MIDLSSLPKKPEEALRVLLQELHSIIPESEAEIRAYAKSHKNAVDRIELTTKAARVASRRLSDATVSSIAQKNLAFNKGSRWNLFKKDVEIVLEALLVAEFDQHFLDDECVSEFDLVELTEDEKTEIRMLLASARKLTENADYLSPDHKRRIVHRIAQVENELFKETSGFKAFLSAAADVSGLVKKFGEDAKPLAEAIETARTITERKVEGYKKIEAEEKPKQLPGPKSEN